MIDTIPTTQIDTTSATQKAQEIVHSVLPDASVQPGRTDREIAITLNSPDNRVSLPNILAITSRLGIPTENVEIVSGLQTTPSGELTPTTQINILLPLDLSQMRMPEPLAFQLP